MCPDTTADVTRDTPGEPPRRVPALCLCWSLHEPSRIGEVALLPRPGREIPFGRGDAAGPGRLRFAQLRPGRVTLTPDLDAPAVSREQLRLVAGEGVIHVENVGRCELTINGRRERAASVRPGDVVHLRHQLSLLAIERSAELPAHDVDVSHTFGEADDLGIVGESEAAWQLRHQLGVAARVQEHLLIIGEPGSGVTLAAEAIHRAASGHARPLVVRRAAELGDASELSGEPNGLIAAAAGGALVLDTIEDLPSRLSATLARILDAPPPTLATRIIATTRRADANATLSARLPLRVRVPPLTERREDIPLLFRALSLRALATAPELRARFVDAKTGEPRIDPRLMGTLTSTTLPGNVRDLDVILWTSIAETSEDHFGMTGGVARQLGLGHDGERPEPTPDDIECALDRHAGNQSRAYRELGLSSRYALIRLMKKHGITHRAR